MGKTIPLLVLTHNYPRYRGDYAGVFISLLASRLAGHNIKPIILSPHDRGASEYEQIGDVTVYRFRYAEDSKDENLAYRGNMQQLAFRLPGGPFKFRRFLGCFHSAALDIIEKERIQIVSGHWLVPSGLVMKKIAREKHLPMILSSHGTDIRLMMKYRKAAYRYFKQFCHSLHKWTVVSSFLKDETIKLDNKLADIVEILPLPHDETIFYREESTQRDSNLIVSVTRFTEQKRVDYLIKAFAIVAEKNPKAKLEIYGSGPLQTDIERLINDLNMRWKVKLFQPVPQEKLREVYNRAGMVVLNSYREGFGLALSEAMLCGAAVIGTDSGGIPDIVAHRERGLLVPLDDTTALANAIQELLDNNSLRQTLADNGYRFACDNYASGPLAARYAQMVQGAL